MSEALEKVLGVDTLPLFPLGLVMLPNEVVPLHIFEPRYRQLLADLPLSRNMFGLIRFEPPEGTSQDRPEPGAAGCVAEVRESQTMPDGRSNIVTAGVIRFRLLEYVDAGTPYLTGRVEFFEDETEKPASLDAVANEVFGLFERVAKAAFRMSGNRGSFPEIPQADPEKLSFLVTAAFNLDNDLKYELLVLTSTALRLERLRGILLKAVDQMEESAAIHEVSQTNGHSKKKIDL